MYVLHFTVENNQVKFLYISLKEVFLQQYYSKPYRKLSNISFPAGVHKFLSELPANIFCVGDSPLNAFLNQDISVR